MLLGWGIFIAVLGFTGWIGQVLTTLSPKLAVRLGMAESETDVNPVFAADFKAEALWDCFILWVFPFSGLLLALQNSHWPFWAIFGGTTYFYFSGRNILQRISMRRKGIDVGTDANVKTAYLFCSLWGISGIITVLLAVKTLMQ